jgi:hypothetical protein
METIIYNGKKITLTNDPHLAGGSFPVGSDGMYNGNWYEATGRDGGGAEYIVRWTNVDWDSIEDGDESDACDWNNPDYVDEL